MDKTWHGDEPKSEQSETAPSAVVVDFVARQQAAKAIPGEPFFTDAERREMREMLAYYRVARPQFEAIKRGCPTARDLLGDE